MNSTYALRLLYELVTTSNTPAAPTAASANKSPAQLWNGIANGLEDYIENSVTITDPAANVAAAAALTVVDTNLAAVSGVDGTGSNAASKADVDSRLTTIETFADATRADLAEIRAQLNEALDALKTAGIMEAD